MKDYKDIIFDIKHIRVVRILVKPIIDFSRFITEKIYRYTVYSKRLKTYKDLYIGERCFVIGNGPSLSGSDLDMIKNEYSFAANRIYNIFERTKWRPTFYVSTDIDIIRQEHKNISNLEIKDKFINIEAKRFFSRKDPINYLYLKGKLAKERNKFVQSGVSEDVSKYSTRTQTVTCVSMELAMYMGFKEIYLLGVDHNFAKYVDSDGILHNDSEIKTYFEGMKGNDSQAILYVDDTTACYEVVKEYAIKHGVRIVNATRGGKLEVYEREKLEEILGNVSQEQG